MLSLNNALWFLSNIEKQKQREDNGHVFRVQQFIMYHVCFHTSWPLTRHTRPNRIPMVCFDMFGFFKSLAVQSPLNNISKQFGLRSDPKFYKERYFLKSYHDKKKGREKINQHAELI